MSKPMTLAYQRFLIFDTQGVSNAKTRYVQFGQYLRLSDICASKDIIKKSEKIAHVVGRNTCITLS